MTEYQEALALADRVLDKPMIDPDGDICVLARQLLRANEALTPRPIFSAPRSLLRERINLYWPQRGWFTGYYVEQDKPPPRSPPCGFKSDHDMCVPKEQPTHWLPLPMVPKQDREAGSK